MKTNFHSKALLKIHPYPGPKPNDWNEPWLNTQEPNQTEAQNPRTKPNWDLNYTGAPKTWRPAQQPKTEPNHVQKPTDLTDPDATDTTKLQAKLKVELNLDQNSKDCAKLWPRKQEQKRTVNGMSH